VNTPRFRYVPERHLGTFWTFFFRGKPMPFHYKSCMAQQFTTGFNPSQCGFNVCFTFNSAIRVLSLPRRL
jgi:hypothetical protein